MELIEGREAKGDWRLPKNIRQMGEPGQGTKILIEDYVYTFLQQMAQNNLTCIKTAVLAGRVVDHTAVYIEGAIEIDMGQELKGWFSYEHWREIFQELQNWFDGLEVVGWYMANPGFPPVLTDELKNLHVRNFSGSSHVFFQTDVLDTEEVFYMRGEKGLAPVCGYYIYYEKNDRMQEYMSRQNGGLGIEPEGVMRDRAAARFRNVMQEKREQSAQKKMFAFLYTSCMFLVLVILVIGVTLVNNYDRMANMESTLHQISENLGADPEEIEAGMEAENRQAQTVLAEAQEEGQTGEEDGRTEDTQSSEGADQDSSLGADAGAGETSAGSDGTIPEEPAGSDSTAKGDHTGADSGRTEEKPAGSEETSTQPAGADEDASGASQEQGTGAPDEQVQEAASGETQEPERYRVREGDTLLEICRSRYGTDDMLEQVCDANGLEDGNVIQVGEIILLP